MDMEQLKENANNYFKQGNYIEAINLYTQILDNDMDNHFILSNRAVAFIKLEKYEEALNDAIKSTKLAPEWGKAWGRLGGALYGLSRFDESLVAYTKAFELEPLEIYQTMINDIKTICQNKKQESIRETFNQTPVEMNDMISSMFDSVLENPKLMEKLSNPKFQEKVLSLQSNPMEAFRDNDIMGIMNEMMKSMKF
jgi:small glutamine-rich tetratricopeptide repeat-containing protein alpha